MTGPERPALLALESVSAGYGGRRVLQEVDLRVAPGEVVGLVGPNGSGKTTLVRAVSRTLPLAGGRVTVGGRDLSAMSAREAAREVAVVPQELSPVFAFTVLEVVLMGRAPYRSAWGGGGADDHARARDAMEAMGVHHLADRDLDELSGGEKQRVVLAQALAQDAPVLLLDEPTTHLDLRHVVRSLDTVRELARSGGRAVLAIFHDLNLASAYCDRLVALAGGRVVAEGPPESVVTTAFLREVYGVEGDVFPHPGTGRPTVLPGPALAPVAASGRPRAHVVGGAGRGGPAMRALSEAGFEVTAGVLHAGDTDAIVAERLNLERVTVPPFSAVDAAAEEEALELMRRASVVVVCDAPYGPGNVGNLRAAKRAADKGARLVLLESVPMRERDFTGGEALGLWEQLHSKATTVGTYDELLSEVSVEA